MAKRPKLAKTNALKGKPFFVYDTPGFRKMNAVQEAFHACKANHVLAYGGQRAGKTWAVANEVRRHAVQYPGTRILVVKYTLSEIFGSIDKTLFGDSFGLNAIIPADWILKDKRQSQILPHVLLKNGSEIHYGGLTNRGRWGGTEFGVVVIDDVFHPKRIKGQILKPDYEYISGRTSLNVPERRVYLTTNTPPNKDHWTFTTFPETATSKKARFLFKTSDNRDNLPASFEEDLRASQSVEWVRRFFDGEPVYEADGPAAITDFDDVPGGRHIKEGLKPMPGLPLWVSWDFGFHHPAVTVHQITPDKRPIWRILYEKMATDIRLRDWIPVIMGSIYSVFDNMYKDHQFVYNHCCDHTGTHGTRGEHVAKDGGLVRTEVEVLNSYDIYPISRPVLHESRALNVIQDYIQRNDFMAVDSTCEMVIAILSGGLQMEQDGAGHVKDTTRRDDYLEHIADTLRYVVINAVQPEGGVPNTQAIGYPRYYDQGVSMSPQRTWEQEYGNVIIPVRK